jgi:predicted nucleotidyltransferase
MANSNPGARHSRGGTVKDPHVDLEERLTLALSSRREVLFARLFGSRANERARPGSDVDLAVLLSPEIAAGLRASALRRLDEMLYERFPGLIFHVVNLATAPPLLQVEIMTRGQTLIPGRAGLEEDLRLKALKLFFDAAPLYKARRARLASMMAAEEDRWSVPR